MDLQLPTTNESRPLFELYPKLANRIPHITIAHLPTPVQRLSGLERELAVSELYVKRDDLTGHVYGGNKIRKLEFLLAHAIANKAHSVLTFGYAGSNHALATSIYAKRFGLKSICMLLPQPNAHYVQKNLLRFMKADAELQHHRNKITIAISTAWVIFIRRLIGKRVMIIAPGGSSALGTVGYVNAALEFAQQVAAGLVPEPTRIYVPLGTMGTFVGLLIGLKVAHMNSRVVGVRVVDKSIANENRIIKLFNSTIKLLRRFDLNFPFLNLSPAEFEVRHEYYGKGYAMFTPEGMQAVSSIARTDGIHTEGTYTGKTLAALINDIKKKDFHKPIMFWNTYNSQIETDSNAISYKLLPKAFHQYYEHPVQPLDL